MASSRESWTIEDYAEELSHLYEMDEMPWIDRRIEELKAEMKQKYSTTELLASGGFTHEDFKR